MPTNANLFNSRVTSEALEAKFRATFPAQGGAELVQDLFASGVIQPVVDFTAVAEGSALRSDLQTAWDISTGFLSTASATASVITNTGFWKISSRAWIIVDSSAGDVSLAVTDGITSKKIYEINSGAATGDEIQLVESFEAVVFLKAGESLTQTAGAAAVINTSYRQIADVYGNLIQPLGYTSS